MLSTSIIHSVQLATAEELQSQVFEHVHGERYSLIALLVLRPLKPLQLKSCPACPDKSPCSIAIEV